MSIDKPVWWQEPLLGPVDSGCLKYPVHPVIYELTDVVAVGFGFAGVTKDDELLWKENNDDENFPTLQEFEDMAMKDPDHDWRVQIEGPLWSGTWQRHGEGSWELITKGGGFA